MSSTVTLPDVLTLAEAAEYLRVSEGDVVELARAQRLPGRRIGSEWRFLRSALQDWLRTPEREDFWSRHFGALKGDPHLEAILERTYRERARPMTEQR